jgi:hypothetical protein
MSELESVSDARERILSECIQMKGEYIAEGEFNSFGENPYSHRQSEILNHDRGLYIV